MILHFEKIIKENGEPYIRSISELADPGTVMDDDEMRQFFEDAVPRYICDNVLNGDPRWEAIIQWQESNEDPEIWQHPERVWRMLSWLYIIDDAKCENTPESQKCCKAFMHEVRRDDKDSFIFNELHRIIHEDRKSEEQKTFLMQKILEYFGDYSDTQRDEMKINMNAIPMDKLQEMEVQLMLLSEKKEDSELSQGTFNHSRSLIFDLIMDPETAKIGISAAKEADSDFVDSFNSFAEEVKDGDDEADDEVVVVESKTNKKASSTDGKRSGKRKFSQQSRLLSEVRELGIIPEDMERRRRCSSSSSTAPSERHKPVVFVDDGFGSEEVPVVLDDEEEENDDDDDTTVAATTTSAAAAAAAAAAEATVVDDGDDKDKADRDAIQKIHLFTYDGIDVTVEDLLVLKPGCLLNDVIIEMYMKFIEKECIAKEDRDQYQFFNPFFIKKLSLSAKGDGTMLRWTRDVKIFDKTFLILPVNQFNHWFLVVVCLKSNVFEDQPTPMILLFDSLGTCSLGKIGQRIRRWLSVEWDHSFPSPPVTEEIPSSDSPPLSGRRRSAHAQNAKFTREQLPSCVLKDLPHQQNNEDCGVFLLQYCEYFVRNRPRRIIDFNSSWFDLKEIPRKREEICKIIMSRSGENREIAINSWKNAPTPVEVPEETDHNQDSAITLDVQDKSPTTEKPKTTKQHPEHRAESVEQNDDQQQEDDDFESVTPPNKRRRTMSTNSSDTLVFGTTTLEVNKMAGSDDLRSSTSLDQIQEIEKPTIECSLDATPTFSMDANIFISEENVAVHCDTSIDDDKTYAKRHAIERVLSYFKDYPSSLKIIMQQGMTRMQICQIERIGDELSSSLEKKQHKLISLIDYNNMRTKVYDAISVEANRMDPPHDSSCYLRLFQEVEKPRIECTDSKNVTSSSSSSGTVKNTHPVVLLPCNQVVKTEACDIELFDDF